MGDYGVFYAPTLFSLAAAWIAFRLLPDKWQFSENLGLDYSTYSNGLEVEHPYMLATRKARLSRAKSHGDGDGKVLNTPQLRHAPPTPHCAHLMLSSHAEQLKGGFLRTITPITPFKGHFPSSYPSRPLYCVPTSSAPSTPSTDIPTPSHGRRSPKPDGRNQRRSFLPCAFQGGGTSDPPTFSPSPILILLFYARARVIVHRLRR